MTRYRLFWRTRSDTCHTYSGYGSPMDRQEAQAWADLLTVKYPATEHWLVPVADGPAPQQGPTDDEGAEDERRA